VRKRLHFAVLSFIVVVAALGATPAILAVEPDEVLDDPVLEARAREISRHLRCVVCQSQSIDESSAPLAKDMRILVRERLIAGDSDEDVYAYLVNRYGDYVLLMPPVQRNTVFLWAAPAVIFLVSATAAGVYLVRMQRVAAKSNAADKNGECDDKTAE